MLSRNITRLLFIQKYLLKHNARNFSRILDIILEKPVGKSTKVQVSFPLLYVLNYSLS